LVTVSVLLATTQVTSVLLIDEVGLSIKQVPETRVIEEGNFTVIYELLGTEWAGLTVILYLVNF